MTRTAILRATIALCAIAALPACKKGVEAKNESAAAVAEKVQKSGELTFEPGRWESTIKLLKMDVTGVELPPEAKAAMQGQIGQEKKFDACLTPEEAKKPKADFFKMAEGCTYKSFSMGGGKIDAEMTCSEQGQNRTMKMTGTYDSKSYSMNVEGTGAMPGGMNMTMAMTMSSKNTGACTGKEKG